MATVIRHAAIPVRTLQGIAWETHDIRIENSIIQGFDGEIQPGDSVMDGTGQILFPPFFNIHCHLGESLYQIEGNDWTISKYLAHTSEIQNSMNPEERDRYWMQSAEVTIRELIKNGTGGFCAARSAEIAQRYHLCTMAGYPLMLSKKLKAFHAAGLSGYMTYYHQHVSQSCAVGIFLHSLYMADEALLRLTSDCFQYHADFITVHISEDMETRRMEQRKFGKPPVFVLEEYGLLKENTILVHGGYLSEEELLLIQKRNAVIAVCPISNVFLNTRMPDIAVLKKYHIRWCLATDGLATGRTFSMAAQAAKLKEYFPFLKNEEILESMTVIPAQIFRKKSYSGEIRTGTKAAFIAVQGNAEEPPEVILEAFFSDKALWSVIDYDN